MRLSRLFVAAGLVLVFAAAASAAPQAKAQKKAAKPVQGVIESVEKDKAGGTITVKIQQKKAAAAAPAQATEKKFQITEATKIEKAAAAPEGQKKAPKGTAGTPATFSDLSKGLQVAVTAKAGSDVAEKVTILGQAKKKKIK